MECTNAGNILPHMGNVLFRLFTAANAKGSQKTYIKSQTLKSNMEIKTTSLITCPACGYLKEEKMQLDACQYFYECENCKTILKPKEGDCCIFCSYGTEKCPPVQQQYLSSET